MTKNNLKTKLNPQNPHNSPPQKGSFQMPKYSTNTWEGGHGGATKQKQIQAPAPKRRWRVNMANTSTGTGSKKSRADDSPQGQNSWRGAAQMTFLWVSKHDQGGLLASILRDREHKGAALAALRKDHTKQSSPGEPPQKQTDEEEFPLRSFYGTHAMKRSCPGNPPQEQTHEEERPLRPSTGTGQGAWLVLLRGLKWSGHTVKTWWYKIQYPGDQLGERNLQFNKLTRTGQKTT